MKHVLVVEDDMLLAQHYERVMSREYKVTMAGNAIEAIDVLDQQSIDVVFIDMLLTGTTAMTLLHEMMSHEDLARIPVVVITSMAEQLSLGELKPYGVKRLLDKATMVPEDLTAAIRALT
jgi:DNA-binding NtrC family response regulator